MSGGQDVGTDASGSRATLLATLPGHGKVVATIAFVAVVVATPQGNWPALAGYVAIVLGLLWYARVPRRTLRLTALLETPVLVFAALLPLVGAGPRREVLGVSLSESGLLGGSTLAVKASIGVLAATALAASTPSRQLLVALERLRMPDALVAIASFMLRYAAVLTDDFRRMRMARAARGASGRTSGHLAAVAAGAGTVFVRSYERGERVHRAMLARGYSGRMPDQAMSSGGDRRGALAVCALLPGGALAVLAVSVGPWVAR